MSERETFNLEDVIMMCSSFAIQCDDTRAIMATIATMMTVHADAQNMDLLDFVDEFADFMRFSVADNHIIKQATEKVTKAINNEVNKKSKVNRDKTGNVVSFRYKEDEE